MSLVQVYALLAILAVFGTPAATVAANSPFYDQIFTATSGGNFETAVDNFFLEALTTTLHTPTGILLQPAGSPLGSKYLGNSYYLETSVTSAYKVGFIELFFDLAGTRAATFNVKITQGGTTIINVNQQITLDGWKTFGIPA